MARFEWKAKVGKKGIARVKLMDPSGRVVAKGKGPSVTEAQQDAIGKAENEDAKLYLQQVFFPDRATKKPRAKAKP
jgi:hypothetical protein